MDNNGTPDWPAWAIHLIDIAKWVMAGIGTLLSAVGLFAVKRYSGHISKLNKHDAQLIQDDKERGELKAFRIEAQKAPYGESLNATIQKLEREDRRLHHRISKRDDALEELKTSMTRTETHVEWIVKELKSRKGSE